MFPRPQHEETQMASEQPGPKEAPSFEDRMNALGHDAQEAGERWGREWQAAGERWSRDPVVVGTVTWAARAWGLIVLAVGLWFFADVTLQLSMPAVAWGDLWPVVLILIGLGVVIRASMRRSS
jgi:hypothetical protein